MAEQENRSLTNYIECLLIKAREGITANTKTPGDKNYTFVYKDKKHNELKREIVEAKNRRDAIRISKEVLANTKLEDLEFINIIAKP